jgi:hypothetical protein
LGGAKKEVDTVEAMKTGKGTNREDRWAEKPAAE